jgi:hypothetical protein
MLIARTAPFFQSCQMKVSNVFQSDAELRARWRSGPAIEVSVRFFDWVRFDAARAVLSGCGIEVTRDRFGFRKTLVVRASAPALERLSRSPEVVWIEPRRTRVSECDQVMRGA